MTGGKATPECMMERIQTNRGKQPMPFKYPQFSEKVPIDHTRSWTAVFESFDERKLDLYYIVTLYEEGKQADRFIVCVFPWWAGEDWADPTATCHLQEAIHAVAVTGRTNTDYKGSLCSFNDV